MSFLLDLGLRLLITFVFAVINAIAIRELVGYFTKIEDNSIGTSSIVAIWISLILLVLSYLSLIPFSSWLIFIANLFFIFIFKKYYKIKEWSQAIKLWLYWFLFFVVVGAIVMLGFRAIL
jgi:hypothetical protein